jgi:hypothetical protein
MKSSNSLALSISPSSLVRCLLLDSPPAQSCAGEMATVSINAGTGRFNPSTYQGQKQWRFLTAYLTYTTPELFGGEGFLTLSRGWQTPGDFFVIPPESKFFVNNTFLSSSRRIATNGILWSGSYSTWGGYENHARRLVLPDNRPLARGALWNRNAKSRSLFRRLPGPRSTASIG